MLDPAGINPTWVEATNTQFISTIAFLSVFGAVFFICSPIYFANRNNFFLRNRLPSLVLLFSTSLFLLAVSFTIGVLTRDKDKDKASTITNSPWPEIIIAAQILLLGAVLAPISLRVHWLISAWKEMKEKASTHSCSTSLSQILKNHQIKEEFRSWLEKEPPHLSQSEMSVSIATASPMGQKTFKLSNIDLQTPSNASDSPSRPRLSTTDLTETEDRCPSSLLNFYEMIESIKSIKDTKDYSNAVNEIYRLYIDPQSIHLLPASGTWIKQLRIQYRNGSWFNDPRALDEIQNQTAKILEKEYLPRFAGKILPALFLNRTSSRTSFRANSSSSLDISGANPVSVDKANKARRKGSVSRTHPHMAKQISLVLFLCLLYAIAVAFTKQKTKLVLAEVFRIGGQSVVLLQGLKSIFAGEIPDDVFKFRRELNAIIVIIFLNVLVGDVIMNALGRQDIRYWITLSTLLLLYISTVPLVLYRKFSFDRRYATKSTKLIPSSNGDLEKANPNSSIVLSPKSRPVSSSSVKISLSQNSGRFRSQSDLPSQTRTMSTAPVSTPVPPSRHLSISQPDILLDLHAVLRDATLSVALEEYLMAEFSVENLHFYQAVAEFRVCEDPEELAAKMEYIYNTFIVEDCPSEVNISSVQKDAVRRRIEAGDFDATLFDNAQREIMRLIQNDALPRFRRSFLSGSVSKYTGTLETVKEGEKPRKLSKRRSSLAF